MYTRHSNRRAGLSSGVVLAAVALIAFVAPAGAIDWGGVSGKDIVLFYPGQASWEWVLTESDHSGGPKFREGKDCRECHKGEEQDIGAKIVSGEKLEPHPIAGKRPTIPVNVKAAHDGERLYVRLEWPDAGPASGAKQDPDFEAKATMILGDDAVVEAKRAGCWGTCHDDLMDMPSDAGKKLTKYLARSRTKVTRQGGGESYKSDTELAKLEGEGIFLELWQAELNRGAPAKASDGYILDKLHLSDSPAVAVEGGLEGGKWVAVLSRKLKLAAAGRKDIVPGTVYSVGFAIHDQWAAHRFHHVSFRSTLALDQGDADIVAVKR